MTYDELRERLLALPGATSEWVAYTLSYADGGSPVPTSYCLMPLRESTFAVFKGDERGGSFRAKADDGDTPLTFDSEDAACRWIWSQIMWWRDFEARRAAKA